MSSKSSSIADCNKKEKNRPKRLAAQRANVYLNDNLDWNEERALQKALEASLIDQAARSQPTSDDSCTGDWSADTEHGSFSDMSPRQANCQWSNRNRTRHRKTASSSDHGSSKNVFKERNTPTKDETRKNGKQIDRKQHENSHKVSADLISDCPSKSDDLSEKKKSTEECNNNKSEATMVVESQQNSLPKHSNHAQSSSECAAVDNTVEKKEEASGGDDLDTSNRVVKYLDDLVIRRTVEAQRKFASKSFVFPKLTQPELGKEQARKPILIKKEVVKQRAFRIQADPIQVTHERMESQTDIIKRKDFDFFPNKAINCRDFITWFCHSNMEDIGKMRSMVTFPNVYRCPAKFSDHLPVCRHVRACQHQAMMAESRKEPSSSLKDENSPESNPKHARAKCNKKPNQNDDPNPTAKPLVCSFNDDALTRSNTRFRKPSDQVPSIDVKAERNKCKPSPENPNPATLADDYSANDSDPIDADQDSEPIEPRITRSKKNITQTMLIDQNKILKAKSAVGAKTRWNSWQTRKLASNAEEIRKRALQYEPDIRQTMKDIESKYDSKRFGQQNCTPSTSNPNQAQKNLRRLQCNSDHSEENWSNLEPSGQAQNSNTLRTVHSLRRIKTLRQAVLSKTSTNNAVEAEDCKSNNKRCSARMSSSGSGSVATVAYNNGASSSNIVHNNSTSFDIRTRASMRRTRSSKFHHQNRNKNNFMFQQYDGKALTCRNDPGDCSLTS